MYKKAIHIEDAIQLTLQKMLQNKGAYPLRSSSLSYAEVPSGNFGLTNGMASRRHRIDETDDDLLAPEHKIQRQADDHEEEFVEDVVLRKRPDTHTSMSSIEGKLKSFEQQIHGLRHNIQETLLQLQHAQKVSLGQSSLDPAITRAIDQLDALRKHLMTRVDAEVQLMRSASAVSAGVSQKAQGAGIDDASTILTLHQILARLSRIEQQQTPH